MVVGLLEWRLWYGMGKGHGSDVLRCVGCAGNGLVWWLVLALVWWQVGTDGNDLFRLFLSNMSTSFFHNVNILLAYSRTN